MSCFWCYATVINTVVILSMHAFCVHIHSVLLDILLRMRILVLLGSQNREKEYRMAVAKKTRKGNTRENRTKEGPRTRVRTSWLAQFTQSRPRGRKKHIKRSQRARGFSLSLSLSLLHACLFSLSSLLFVSFGSACPHDSWMYFPLFSK